MEDVAELYKLVRDKVNPKTNEEEADLFSTFYSVFRNKLPGPTTKTSKREHAAQSMTPDTEKKNTSKKTNASTENVLPGQKRCPNCERILDIETGFSKYKTKDGRIKVQGYCRDCNKARIADYNKRKKEKFEEGLAKSNPTLEAF